MDDTSADHATTQAVSSIVSEGMLQRSAKQPTVLGRLCGPHCGMKDKHIGHCDVCHMLTANALKLMENHLGGEDRRAKDKRRRNGNG